MVTASPAAAQTTPVFRLDDDNGATTANYLSFLSQIRANVDYEAQDVDNTVEGTTDLVDHTNPTALGYTEAIIVTEAGHQVRLRFRTSDMYLVGWFDSNSHYHYLGARVEARVPASDNEPPQLTSGADYGTLESLGQVDRTTMVFGRIQTETHALSLWKSSSTQGMAAATRSELNWVAWFVPATPGAPTIDATIAQSALRYMVNRNIDGAATYRDVKFTAAEFKRATAANNGMYDATDPDLPALRAAGGKLILWAGCGDPAISPIGTVACYTAVEKATGGSAATRQFARLFMLPGMAHCGGGQGPSSFDGLTAVTDWVIKDQAPGSLLTSMTDSSGKTTATRPVYPYRPSPSTPPAARRTRPPATPPNPAPGSAP
jgi:hypothetical protein